MYLNRIKTVDSLQGNLLSKLQLPPSLSGYLYSKTIQDYGRYICLVMKRITNEGKFKLRQLESCLYTIFIAFSAVARIQRNLGVHSPRQRKCNTHIYWSSSQPLKRRKSYHFNRDKPWRHHVKWNKPVINTTWSHLYVNSEKIELIDVENWVVVSGTWGKVWRGRETLI